MCLMMPMKISSVINLESINKLIFECNYKHIESASDSEGASKQQQQQQNRIITVN